MPRFETPGPISAEINLPVGDLVLSASDRTDTVVTIAARHPKRSTDVALAEQTTVSWADSRLVIEAPAKRWNVLGPTASIQVTVHLPTGSDVRATSAVGSIVADGRFGRCEFRAKVGSVRVDRLHGGAVKADVGEVKIGTSDGPLEVTANVGMIRIAELVAAATLRSTHGGIAVRRTRHQLDASCSSGSIQVDEADGAVDLRTSYGSVGIGSVGSGRVRLESSFGSLEVGVAGGVPVWLDATSGRGTVYNQLDVTGPPSPGEPFVELRARTDGDIRVRRAPARTPVEPRDTPEPQDTAEPQDTPEPQPL